MVKNYVSRQLFQVLFYPGLFVLLLWTIFFIQVSYQINLNKLGVLPREIRGLPGIFTSVFIHGDIAHIASNSIPLLVLGSMLFYFYKKIARPTFLWIWFVSGLWLWIGGRNSEAHPTFHIGASTLIYGLATFLFFSGVFRRHLRLMAISALVVFLYGSIMWGIFPLKEEMSWEGHLFGAIAGVLVAYNYRGEGPQRRVYEWEEEDDDEELPSTDEIMGETDSARPHDFTVRYIYKKRDDEK
jgi:membrane associated rhomboid family serine protease